jgi:MFS family permease
MGADMVFSVWPLFLTNVLKANRTAIGLIDGAGDAMVSLSQAAAGYASDRMRKRKIFVQLGYFCGGIARVGYSLAPSWLFVLPFRILDRSGKMRSTPRDAIVSDVSTFENRGTHFGFLRMMDNGGAVIGVMLSLILVQFLPYRTIFLIAALPSMLAVLLVSLRVRERVTRGGWYRGIRLRDLSPNVRRLFLVGALQELSTFSYSFLILASAHNGIASSSTPLLYLIFTVTATIISLPAGRFADCIGRKHLLYLSYLAWATVCLTFLVQPHPTLIILAFIVYGLHKGMLDPVQKTFVAELAHKDYVASTLGGFQLVIGLISFPASLMAGLLWDSYGFTAPFLLSFVLICAAALVLLSVKEERFAPLR